MEKTERKHLYTDHHNHVSTNIVGKDSATVANCKSIDEAYDLVNSLKPNRLYNVLAWQWPTCDTSRIDSNIPIIISHYSLHDYHMNKRGAEVLLEKSDNPIKHGFIKHVLDEKDPIWIEKNLAEIFSMLNGLYVFNVEGINEWFRELEENYGIYSTEDMLTPSEDFIDKVNMSDYAGRCKFWVGLSDYKQWGKNAKSKLDGIKIFIDGGMGVRTAAVKNGYQNPLPGYENGLLIYTDEQLGDALKVVEESGLNVSMHCIGDHGIEQILRVIETYNVKIPLIRIEHAQFITKAQAMKCKVLGITLCMQPNFSYDTTADIPLRNDIMNPDVLTHNNPFRMLIDEVGYEIGKDLIFGTDGMPQGIPEGYADDESLYPPMRMSEEELLKGYAL